jgi:hypothetical protein
VPGREQIPPNDGAGTELPVLPATVSAAHLRTCAASLASATSATNARYGIGELGALAEVITALVDSQRHLATTLANLAGRVSEGQTNGTLAAAPVSDLRALTEILAAASNAAGHTTEALAEAAPAVDALLDSVGSDTRLT